MHTPGNIGKVKRIHRRDEALGSLGRSYGCKYLGEMAGLVQIRGVESKV